MGLKPRRSLAQVAPQVAAEWHPSKNGDVTPADVAPATHRKFWWVCSAGPDHEWEASPANRTKGRGCPFCAGRRVSVTNALTTQQPALAAQWHPIKNTVRVEDITVGSNRRVWWKCPAGPDHEWEQRVCTRAAGIGCPFCSGSRVSVTNTIDALAPSVAREWHPTRNGDLLPSAIVAGSHSKAWWRCGAGHEWHAQIKPRTSVGAGCPFCAGQRATEEHNLQEHHPDLAAQWHPAKNGDLTPGDVRAGSDKRVWWKCERGPDHEWRESVYNRARGFGCVFCSGRRASLANNLAAVFPDLAAQWHPTKNAPLTPDTVASGTHRSVWWKCPEGPDHEWKGAIVYRTSKQSGCPFCAGLRASQTNSLAERFPALAQEWHPRKNGKLTPADVAIGTTRKVWWECPADSEHEWQTGVDRRTRDGTGCPYCSLVPRSKQEIHLAAELALFFDVNLDRHRLKINGRPVDVDIVLPTFKLVVEFDGSYWHADLEERDRAKTALLEAAGWRVVRARERPLKKLGEHDVVVPFNNAKRTADLVIGKIAAITGDKPPGLARYLKRRTLANGKTAQTYIERLLAERAGKVRATECTPLCRD